MKASRTIHRFLFALLLTIASFSVQAENMIMIRVTMSFDNAMILVKEKLNEYGYTIAHIQKCDGGLTDFGYKTDMYKSIFFGKFEEMRFLTNKYPQLIPYLPLKIAVMQEKDNIVFAALNPDKLYDFFHDEELRNQFGRWENDLRAIFEEIKHTSKQAVHG